jgi:hypothetical protein
LFAGEFLRGYIMARYYKIKVGSTWLTHNGLEAGRACRINVDPASALVVSTLGNVSIGADGTPFREKPLTPTGAGRVFRIVAAFVEDTVYNALKAALDTAGDNNTDINVTGEGTPGDFDVDAVVFDDPTYIKHESFSGTTFKNVTISLVTTAIN